VTMILPSNSKLLRLSRFAAGSLSGEDRDRTAAHRQPLLHIR
jgi:hypothetical protein